MPNNNGLSQEQIAHQYLQFIARMNGARHRCADSARRPSPRLFGPRNKAGVPSGSPLDEMGYEKTDRGRVPMSLSSIPVRCVRMQKRHHGQCRRTVSSEGRVLRSLLCGCITAQQEHMPDKIKLSAG